MKLSLLAEEVRDAKILGGDAEICGLCTDSRTVGKGDLFFCFRGTHTDSHTYARDAEERGAAAIVCERDTGVKCPQLIVPDGREGMARISSAFWDRPEKRLKIVGITGTNGKTTTSHMLFHILEAAGIRTGLIGTLGAKYANKIVPPALTTPDPASLFAMLADMAASGIQVVVMEVSAHALALKKDCPICYDVGIFTNLTQDHLDFFPSMKEYGEAKKSLFSPERCRFAFLNADDPFTRGIIELGGKYETYGLDAPADNFALVESETIRGSRVLINLCDDLVEAKIRLTGRHNVYNALAAAAAARKLGADVETIARGLSQTERVDGRLEYCGSYRGADIFVDFAHTPDGLQKSLAALRGYCRGKLVVAFGCGGNRDRGKRPLMGKTVAELSDFAVITSDNPRYEDPCAIIGEIEAGYAPVSKEYVAIEDRERAIEYAIGLLKNGDVLLVAGKGGETTQEIMGIKYSFNDKDVIDSVIGKLS